MQLSAFDIVMTEVVLLGIYIYIYIYVIVLFNCFFKLFSSVVLVCHTLLGVLLNADHGLMNYDTVKSILVFESAILYHISKERHVNALYGINVGFN